MAALESSLHALGVLGQDNDAAYRFLKAATEAGTWKCVRKWKSRDPTDEAYLDDALRGVSIGALGLTGREEVPALLRKLKELDPPSASGGEPGAFRGALCGAARHYDLYVKLGKQRFRQVLYGPDYDGLQDEWRQSPVGREWLDWAYPFRKIPSLPSGQPRKWTR
ncbi:MAG: hypothetical protein FJ387_28400 [Verrucomicrobia bacterium]|nr:hypothetical protein [Verrucomicrobiota bacterium]